MNAPLRNLLGDWTSRAGLVLFVLAVLMLGSLLDDGLDADQAAVQSAYAAGLEKGLELGRNEVLPSVQAAYRAGLREGEDRERARGRQ